MWGMFLSWLITIHWYKHAFIIVESVLLMVFLNQLLMQANSYYLASFYI